MEMDKTRLVSLVKKAQAGDGTAMNELFSEFYNDVYYFALKTLKNEDLAYEITQETFLEIVENIGKLKEPAAFVTWVKQISYHQCTRYFKKKKDVLVEEDEDGNTIFDTLEDDSEYSMPAEVYEKEEFKKTLMNMINELSEEQRSAIMMLYFEEMSIAEISKVQGVSEGTVKSRLNYARKAMKKTVEDYEEKTGTKLHGIAMLPLMRLVFDGAEKLMPQKAAAIGETVSASFTASAAAGGAAAGKGRTGKGSEKARRQGACRRRGPEQTKDDQTG
jgi:RNA polymerase sigma factor (sigma-70 family)